MSFHEIDLTKVITALGIAIPAIIAAVNSYRNSKLLKQHDAWEKETVNGHKLTARLLAILARAEQHQDTHNAKTPVE